MDFFADMTGKMRMRTQYQYYMLKKHIHFIEIFRVGITLRAIYVRHKTSHRRKSQVNRGTPPQNLYWGDDSDVRPPEFRSYNVLNNAVCRLFILTCTGYNVLHCI